MGRPLNKRFFGTPSVDGNEIKVQFHNGTASVNGWIVKQKGSKRFVCTDGTAEETCVLTDKDSADLLAGEMSITVKLDDDSLAQVTKISGRKITLDTGATSAWTFVTSDEDGAAEIEEAGDDDDLDNADDFEEDE